MRPLLTKEKILNFIQKHRKKMEILGLVVFGIIFSFVVLEITLRTINFLGERQLFNLRPFRTTLVWQEDPLIGKVILKPNSTGWIVTPSGEYFNLVQTNREGFFDTDHQVNKDSNVYRIIFLGDSFVASLQTPLNKTFFKQVEQHLQQKYPSKRIEVIQIGMGDTGTAQQNLALKQIGLKYQPDLVVHMFLTANDIKNNYPTLQGDPHRPYFRLNKLGQLEYLPFTKRSEKKFYSIKEAIKNLRIVEGFLYFRQKIQEQQANYTQDYPIDYHIYDIDYNKDYQQAWQITKKLILETKKITEENNGKYILVALTNNEQVDKSLWSQLQEVYPNLKLASTNLKKPDIELTDFCKVEKLDCMFMLPFFEEEVNKNPNLKTHFKVDGHWTQEGTDLAASFLNTNLPRFIDSNQ